MEVYDNDSSIDNEDSNRLDEVESDIGSKIEIEQYALEWFDYQDRGTIEQCFDTDEACGIGQNQVEVASRCTPVPFPLLSYQWFEKQDKLSRANKARDDVRASIPVECNDEKLLVMNRTKVSGNLDSNLDTIRKERDSCLLQKKIDHLNSILEIGNMLLHDGPIVATQDVSKVYSKTKNLQYHITLSSLYEILCKHLNIIQIYICGKAHIVENRGGDHDVMQLVYKLENMVSV